MKKFLSMRFWLLISSIAILYSCTPQKTENTELPMSYTRGIGVYPGDPDEYLAPEMNKDYTYRNIALHRAVYQDIPSVFTRIDCPLFLTLWQFSLRSPRNQDVWFLIA